MNHKFATATFLTNSPFMTGHSRHTNGTRTCTAIGLLALAAVCATLQAADPQIITPIDAHVSSTYVHEGQTSASDGKMLLEWHINPDGNGVSPSFSEGSKDAPVLTALWQPEVYGAYTWTTATAESTGARVVFALDGAYDLVDAHIWQRGQGGDGYDLSNRDANEIIIEGSKNGEDWQVLTTDPAVNLARTEFRSGSIVPRGAQVFNLTKNNTGIKFVRFTINSNHGSPEYTGLAEVRFTGTPSK